MWLIASGLGGALIAGLVTIIVAKRQRSGRVDTSEAKDLWDTLRGELARLQTETKELRAEITVARQEIHALREDAAAVGTRTVEERLALRSAQAEVRRLRAKIIEMGGDPGSEPSDE